MNIPHLKYVLNEAYTVVVDLEKEPNINCVSVELFRHYWFLIDKDMF